MLKTVIEALDKNDPENFTSDGSPRVDVVSKLVGREVSRKEITEVMLAPVEEPAPAPAPRAKSLGEQYDDAVAALSIADQTFSAAKEERDLLQRKVSRLSRFAPSGEVTREDATKGRKNYIQRQHEIRMAKAMETKRRNELVPPAIDGRSRIDAALQDKSNRNRPKF